MERTLSMDHETFGRILITDDDQSNLEELTDFFNSCGYETVGASDGATAIIKAREFLPDVILLDIRMPGIDGYETCRRLKDNDRTRDIPVIFITALSDTIAKVKGFTAGGVDYVTKPFEIEEIVARINTHITLSRLKREREEIIRELTEALANVKKLEGMLPICMYCKKIKNDEGYWQQVEHYIIEHSGAKFTHGLCDDCCKKYYPGLYEENNASK